MKSSTMSEIVLKKGIIYAVFLCLTLAALVPATLSAQQLTRPDATAAEVTYLGVVDEKLVFRLDFKNESGEKFNVSIKSVNGSIFYSEKHNTKNFSKKFLLSKEDFENAALTFIVTTSSARESYVFNLNKVTSVIENIIVTRR
jgi:hypothetical protein